MKVYILTRFSIYDPATRSFQMARGEQDKYKSILFDPKRLDYKLKSFEKITLPSVVNQTNKNYKWYIFASSYLPEQYKKRLCQLTKKYSRIQCKFIPSFKEFNQWKPEPNVSSYCTIRLDDDDGLHTSFFQQLQKYKKYNKCIVSFPMGKRVSIQNGNIKYGSVYKARNIAIGLCAIGMNIYHCGEHTKVHQKYKVFYNNTPRMYLINCSPYCDTKRGFR